MSEVLMTAEASVPLTHAEVQAIAEDHGIDLLHIKGPALDESLRRPWPDEGTGYWRVSIDADVLVRPAHVGAFAAALREHGWRRLYDFADGSAFEHAATWAHADLASLDVHRYFPGIETDAEAAFDMLWADRQVRPIAGLLCPVPDLVAQRLIVLVHAARGRSYRDQEDRGRAWHDLDGESRAEIDALGERLRARVALRAGTGRLDTVRGERTYALWRHLTSGDTSLAGLWWARVRAAPTRRQGLRVGVRMLVPNRHRMETTLGRPPTTRELLHAYRSRVSLAARTVTNRIRTTRAQRR